MKNKTHEKQSALAVGCLLALGIQKEEQVHKTETRKMP
jgi:hypothetical protein